jgi:membrane protein
MKSHDTAPNVNHPYLDNRFLSISNTVLRTLIILIFGFALVSVLVTMTKYHTTYPATFNFSDLPPVFIGILYEVVAIFIFLYLKKQPLRRSIYLAAAFIITNTVAFYLVFTVPTEPCSDYKAIWQTAAQMASSTFDVNNLPYTDYMRIYNWQLGVSWFESLFIRLFGPDILPLKIFNILLINVSLILTYVLAKKYLGNCHTAALACFLLGSFYPVIVTAPQFTNQHLACVFLLAIITLLSYYKVTMWIAAGLLTATLNTVRPMAIIVIITAVCYGVILIAYKKCPRKILSLVGAYLAVYCICIAAVNHLFIKAGYADGPISSATVPYFKFHKGLTGYDYPEVNKFASIEEFNVWEKHEISNAITEHPDEVAAYMLTKMIRYLGCFDYKAEMTYNHKEELWNAPPVKYHVLFGYGQYIVILILCFYSVIKNEKTDYLRPAFIFFTGITLVYFFIEAFSSYRFESYPYFMILACWGLNTQPKQRTLV